LKIQEIDIDKIIPYINNPRKNLNSDKVASSIKEFGFQQPIVVDKDMSIIVGHTRYEAAKKLDLKTVPVVIADLPPLKAKAYRIADNKLNEGSKWDYNLLNLEFTDLLDNHYEIENLGFDNKELENFIVNNENFSPEDVSSQGLIDQDTKVICKECGQQINK
jgi:ParB-like chromosome segregation protein Spo0J